MPPETRYDGFAGIGQTPGLYMVQRIEDITNAGSNKRLFEFEGLFLLNTPVCTWFRSSSLKMMAISTARIGFEAVAS